MRIKLPLAEDPMSELDRQVLEAWRNAEELEAEPGMDRYNEEVVRARMYAMGLSVAASTVGRPEAVWASPERRELVRAWTEEHQSLRDRLEMLATQLESDARTGEYRGGSYAGAVLVDVAQRIRLALKATP